MPLTYRSIFDGISRSINQQTMRASMAALGNAIRNRPSGPLPEPGSGPELPAPGDDEWGDPSWWAGLAGYNSGVPGGASGDPYGWQGRGGIDTALEQRLKQSPGGQIILDHLEGKDSVDEPGWGEPGFDQFGLYGWGSELTGVGYKEKNEELAKFIKAVKDAKEKIGNDFGKAIGEAMHEIGVKADVEVQVALKKAGSQLVKFPDFFGSRAIDGAGGADSAGLALPDFPEAEPPSELVLDEMARRLLATLFRSGFRHNEWLWGATEYDGTDATTNTSATSSADEIRRALLGGMSSPKEMLWSGSGL